MTAKALKTVPVNDRAWFMAQLRDSLQGGDALLPIGFEGAPTATEISRIESEVPAETAVIIHTSGSSGRPKSVALSAEAIKASAQATNEYLGGAGQWLITLPTHLISGLQMLTRSILGETSPIFYDGKFNPKTFIKAAERLEETKKYTSLVPVQLASLLDYAEEEPRALATLQRFDRVLVGGQATPLALRQKAYDLEVSITRTYGMTETAGGAVYDGVEIGDTQMRIRDGEVQLSGSSLALGYVGDQELTAEKFIVEDGVTWFRTGDSGKLIGGMLTITGRLDRTIISGGVNVSLDVVESAAASFVDSAGSTDSANTVAVATPDEKWGTAIATVTEVSTVTEVNIDTAGELQPLKNPEALQEYLREKLGPAAKPKHLFQTSKLPRLPGGKPDLQTIRSLVLTALKLR